MKGSVGEHDSTGRNTWAEAPILLGNWIEEISEARDIDIEKYHLGNILGSMMTDDLGCFISINLPHLPNFAPGQIQDLLVRMRWEIESQYTPNEVKERLLEFIPRVEGLDPLNAKDFISVRTEWYEEIMSFVESQVRENSSYQSAIHYVDEVNGNIGEEFRELFYPYGQEE